MRHCYHLLFGVLICALALSTVTTARAGAPQLVNYQGLLTDGAGDPLDTTVDLTFTIYDDPSAGSVLWTETQVAVPVVEGLFNVLLGSVTPLTGSVFDDTTRYLGITVGGDPEQTPRTRIVTAPYSFRSEHSDVADSAVIASIAFVANEALTAQFADTALVAVLANLAEIAIFADSARVADNLDSLSSEDFSRTGHTHGGGGGGGWTDDGAVVRLDASADSVGIGTTTPTEKLDVVGNIHASGTIVSGNSITIDGVSDKITASSGTIDFDNENLVTTGKIAFGPSNTNSGVGANVIGIGNTASGDRATVTGGQDNVSSGNHSVVGGGLSDTASGTYSTVSGGRRNAAAEPYATVGGGLGNKASALSATVSGGRSNQASNDYAVVAGGLEGVASGLNSTVGGGLSGAASGAYATVAGGRGGVADTAYASVGGGISNLAGGYSATVPGGRSNSATGIYSFAAGRRAKATHPGAFVWADSTDADFTSTGDNQFLIRASGGVGIGTTTPTEKLEVAGVIYSNSGGFKFPDNTVQTTAATGGGGGWTDDGTVVRLNASADSVGIGTSTPSEKLDVVGNIVVSGKATFGPGHTNTGLTGFVAGVGNTASGDRAAVTGGQDNVADGNWSVVGGGLSNSAIGELSTVAGGWDNDATGVRSSIGGGQGNTAGGQRSTIGGGLFNTASAEHATVPGGRSNAATGNLSFAAGYRAKANHHGAFVWGDSTDSDVASTGVNQFLIRARGGVGIGTTSPDAQLNVESSDSTVDTTVVLRSEYTGTSPRAIGVLGIAVITSDDGDGIGGKFVGGEIGVRAEVDGDGKTTLIGLSAKAKNISSNGFATGVLAEADGPSAGNFAVHAIATGATPINIGIFASASGAGLNRAGNFGGDVFISGTLTKGAGAFKIDHPLDPANKYLVHSFVESPDMMNVYNGNIVLNTNGEAIVTMPDYFHALNRDFRYQLTAIGAPGPNLYIAEEVANYTFRIAGGAPGSKVSWQITGIRQDNFANAHRIQVEELKPEIFRGLYIHPEEAGVSKDLGINASLEKFAKVGM